MVGPVPRQEWRRRRRRRRTRAVSGSARRRGVGRVPSRRPAAAPARPPLPPRRSVAEGRADDARRRAAQRRGALLRPVIGDGVGDAGRILPTHPPRSRSDLSSIKGVISRRRVAGGVCDDKVVPSCRAVGTCAICGCQAGGKAQAYACPGRQPRMHDRVYAAESGAHLRECRT